MSRERLPGFEAISAFGLVCLVWLLHPLWPLQPSLQSRVPVNHIVLFQFHANTSSEVVEEACTRMLSLKDSCVHPTSLASYIRSVTGGRDNSIEGFEIHNVTSRMETNYSLIHAYNEITHAFTVQFESLDDRDYYVNTDPSHRSFVTFLRPIPEKIVVVDYADGHF